MRDGSPDRTAHSVPEAEGNTVMIRWRRLTIAATALAVALGALPPAAWGQTPDEGPPTSIPSGEAPAGETEVHSWALSPAGSDDPDEPGNRPFLSYDLTPGATVDDAVTLFNYGNVQLTFRLYATDAHNNEDGQFDLLPGDTEPEDVGTWVTLPQDHITVPARSQATIPLMVRVPADARPGDHAGAVLAASQVAGTGPDGKTVTLDRRTGSRLYVRVAGPLAPELAIEGVRTTYEPSLNPGSGTAHVRYRIVNRGNVRLAGAHRASISGPFGLGEQDTDPKDLPELLPGEDVELEATFEGVPASVLAYTVVRVDPKGIAGDGGSPSTTRQAITLAIPVSLVALALALAFALYARRSYARHRRDHLATGLTPP